ncbi:MAG: AAA family ATPase [Mucinivorans sp.]
MDSLFLHSGKKIVRQGGEELFFELQWMDIRLPLSVLSSGERQIIHLLECAAMSHQGDMMILDEPEISLHFDWQKRVLEDILSLSPSLQILLATHSPAIIIDGWVDRVIQFRTQE